MHQQRASFETRPAGTPQDEAVLLMASIKDLIVRSRRSGRLEGRNFRVTEEGGDGDRSERAADDAA
jgi:hypothetical protein